MRHKPQNAMIASDLEMCKPQCFARVGANPLQGVAINFIGIVGQKYDEDEEKNPSGINHRLFIGNN